MLRGIDTSRRGMSWEQARTEVIADNLRNLRVSAFKRSVTVGSEFGEMVQKRLGDQVKESEAPQEVGRLGNGATLVETVKDLTQGEIIPTDRLLDVGLQGPGEFTYQGPDGLGYTRDGGFQKDVEGRLVTALGYPVLVNGAPVRVEAGQSLGIKEDGTVLVDDSPVGRLDIRGGEPSTSLAIGSLERANVDLDHEVLDLTTALRSFQVNQRAMQLQDQTLAKAVSEIGKV